MGLFDWFRIKKYEKELNKMFGVGNDDNFNLEEYNKYNNERIQEFLDRYDLSTIDGIESIPISEARRYPDGGKSVVYMPEQILSRKATEYKDNKDYDLAIACLRKVNELYPHSFYAYTRDNYERLVDFLILAGYYSEAKEEHSRLDKLYGSRLDELRGLQDFSAKSGSVSREKYQETIIDPYLEEAHDREYYYWLLENIPNIAPKSFGGFRRMKKLKSDNYLKIKSQVEKMGLKEEDIKFWY